MYVCVVCVTPTDAANILVCRNICVLAGNPVYYRHTHNACGTTVVYTPTAVLLSSVFLITVSMEVLSIQHARVEQVIWQFSVLHNLVTHAATRTYNLAVSIAKL